MDKGIHSNERREIPGGGTARGAARELRAQLLVLAGLLAVVAARSVWPAPHPAAGAARQARSDDVTLRVHAIRELEHLGPDDPEIALPVLIDRLHDAEPEIRAAAATAVFRVVQGAHFHGTALRDAARGAQALFDAQHDPDPGARYAAVQALWMVATCSGTPPAGIDLRTVHLALLDNTTDSDEPVRLAAQRGLAAVGSRLAGALPSPVDGGPASR